MTVTGEITRLLHEADEGRQGALDELMQLVYADLKRVAAKHMHRRFGPDLPGVTLEPAALVNETFLKLIRQRKHFRNRGQFFAISTKVMLRVLMDYHRARSADKRAGGQLRVTLSGLGGAAAQPEPSAAIPALVDALERLEKLDPRKAEVVKLRVIWGLTVPEISEEIETSVATVERDWSFARRWLSAQLSDEQP